MENKENFLKVEIDKNISDEFSYLLAKSPYVSENEIGELFSHLVYMDEAQKEKNIRDFQISSKIIKLKFIINDDGENKVENLQIPLGQGHFSKGINHLREIGKINWENDIKGKSLAEKLSDKFDKFLTKPPAVDLIDDSFNTAKKITELLAVSSPELQEFLNAFFGDKKEKNSEVKKEDTDKNQEINKEEKIAKMKEKAKQFSEKKSNTKERNRERTINKDRAFTA